MTVTSDLADLAEVGAAGAPTRSPAGGLVRPARRPADFVVRGPPPRSPTDAEELAPLWPRPHEDLCWLAGDWRILQRTDGHRFSLDDLVTAYTAQTLFPDRAPATHLDLGCGIGSVLLFTAWRFPAVRSVGVEAQSVSADLARRSIAWNGVGDRVSVREGDFREATTVDGLGPFDLVTGTPPYFPPGTGLESPNVQRGPCRFEHRGGVEAYCAAAAPRLAPGAPFVICAAPGQVDRLISFAPTVGLAVELRCDIIPRTGKVPLLSVFVLRAEAYAQALQLAPSLIVRGPDGQRTDDVRRIRDAMGMPP